MPDRSKVMIQTKQDTLALQVGGWAWGCRSNRKKGQCSSWAVAPEEEEEEYFLF
jgi:hypothetical protein